MSFVKYISYYFYYSITSELMYWLISLEHYFCFHHCYYCYSRVFVVVFVDIFQIDTQPFRIVMGLSLFGLDSGLYITKLIGRSFPDTNHFTLGEKPREAVKEHGIEWVSVRGSLSLQDHLC